MIQQLFIEGKEVDMLPDEPVTLQYRSNMLSDIDKITSSNSLTIRLPKTSRNNVFFKFSDTLYAQGIQRRWYNASYVRNSVPLINGKLALLSADREAYEVCLVWGIFDKLEEWLDSSDTLKNVSLNYAVQLQYAQIENYAKSRVAYGSLYYNNGGEKYTFPSINAGMVYSRVISQLGSIDYSAVDIGKVNELYLLLNEDLVGDLVTPGSSEPAFVIQNYMPDISVVDFFKAINQMMGWYLEIQSGNLVMASIEQFLDKSRAVDWSGKLASYSDMPDSISYNINDYAQRNWLRYKPDDNVSTNADGYIAVNDKTLNLDKNILELPFAATDGGNYVRQYITTITEDGDTNTEFVKTEPRIFKVRDNGPLDENGNEIPELYFDYTLKWNGLIASNYAYFQNIIGSPKVATVQLRLSDFDLLNLDFTKPVYIRQYGSYFAIIEIQNTGDLSTAKLLKIA